MKWLLQNLRRRVGLAIENPRYALSAMIREVTFADERFLARLSGASPRQIRAYLDEPISTTAFAVYLRNEGGHFRSRLRLRVSSPKKPSISTPRVELLPQTASLKPA
jgi:hypothetical protein